MTRDVICIGASAGGVRLLSGVVSRLPADLPAAVLVVLHVSPFSPSALPGILERAGKLPVAHATDGEKIDRGRVYVAPPDFHLLVDGERIAVRKGPRQNRSRPAIDPLFRSAAHAYGPRVIGVVLSGQLADGAAGLAAIKSAGGIAVVVDPAAVDFRAMPMNALERVVADHVVAPDEIGPLLVELVHERVEEGPPMEVPDVGAIVNETFQAQEAGERNGQPAVYTCPECGGVLWEVGDLPTYACHVGHEYSPEGLLDQQTDSVESAMWAAVRALEERASLLRRTVHRLRARGFTRVVQHFENQAAEASRRAGTIRRFVTSESASTTGPEKESEPAIE